MPPRNPELPEGTDHIINGAMETGSDTGGTGTTTGGGSSTGFIGSGSTGGTTGGTGGTALGGSGQGGSGGGDFGGTGGKSGGGSTGGSGAASGATDKIVNQVRSQVSSLKGQATDKAREYADTGKERVTAALDNFTEVVNDAARSVDEKLGEEYGQYAHRAADAVSSFTESLRGKSVDELLDDSRALVRKSPGIAIGTAALLGFALVRVVKAGLNDEPGAGSDTNNSNTKRGGTTAGTSV